MSGPPETEGTCGGDHRGSGDDPQGSTSAPRGKGQSRKKREAQAEPTFLFRPAEPEPSGEGTAKGASEAAMLRRILDRMFGEIARFRWKSGQGTGASRKAQPGTQGTDRGRKAPAGTPSGERAHALPGTGCGPRKVGAGGNASPHFRFRLRRRVRGFRRLGRGRGTSPAIRRDSGLRSRHPPATAMSHCRRRWWCRCSSPARCRSAADNAVRPPWGRCRTGPPRRTAASRRSRRSSTG